MTKKSIKQTNEEAEALRANRMSLVWPSFYSLNQSKSTTEAIRAWKQISETHNCLQVELFAWYLHSYHDIPYDCMELTKCFLYLRGIDGPSLVTSASLSIYVGYSKKSIGREYKQSQSTKKFGAEMRRLCNFFHLQAVKSVRAELANANSIIKIANVLDIQHDLTIVKPLRINTYVNKKKTKKSS